MATQKQLDHDRMRISLARRIEDALGKPESITCYFENQPEDDEQAGDSESDYGLEFNGGDSDQQPYAYIAEEVYNLSEDTDEETGYAIVVAAVQGVGKRFAEALSKMVGYSDKLDGDRQVSAEERIAATIFGYVKHLAGKYGLDMTDEMPLGEEDCNELGRRILRDVLQEFRPDLFDGGGRTPDAVRELHETLSSTVDALDDASGVVDAGEGEEYAYQRDLEDARRVLEKYKPRSA
jgi:hypothetical protein